MEILISLSQVQRGPRRDAIMFALLSPEYALPMCGIENGTSTLLFLAVRCPPNIVMRRHAPESSPFAILVLFRHLLLRLKPQSGGACFFRRSCFRFRFRFGVSGSGALPFAALKVRRMLNFAEPIRTLATRTSSRLPPSHGC